MTQNASGKRVRGERVMTVMFEYLYVYDVGLLVGVDGGVAEVPGGVGNCNLPLLEDRIGLG